jgi:DNA-binding NtrC family response regulator
MAINEPWQLRRLRVLDGALLDVQLGEASIHPAIEELVRRGIPFILVTGQGNLGRPPALLGNAPILTKPFRVEQLENMMSSTFRLRDRGKPHQP